MRRGNDQTQKNAKAPSVQRRVRTGQAILEKEHLGRDMVESKCGAGCGPNCGPPLNARLKKMTFS